MSLADFKREDRRLLILKALASESDYAISDVVMRGLLSEFGHGISMDVMHADLAWLQDVGLLSIEKAGRVVIATVTDRGVDVAEGRSIVPGIRRPRPGE